MIAPRNHLAVGPYHAPQWMLIEQGIRDASALAPGAPRDAAMAAWAELYGVKMVDLGILMDDLSKAKEFPSQFYYPEDEVIYYE